MATFDAIELAIQSMQVYSVGASGHSTVILSPMPGSATIQLSDCHLFYSSFTAGLSRAIFPSPRFTVNATIFLTVEVILHYFIYGNFN